MLLVTGGAGFIGVNFVRQWCREEVDRVVVLDSLTYAGRRDALDGLIDDQRLQFVHGDIADTPLVAAILSEFRPSAIVHFAAESHVDRSIAGPRQFLDTNIFGTYNLLECVRSHFANISPQQRSTFKFLHVSTDEVYGSLLRGSPAFTEAHAYAPNSPYAASKAASDHLVRAWSRTYNVPSLITHCSNNYGPYQNGEKFIPHVISCALLGAAIPIYGDGSNIRDWIHVEDHCRGIRSVLKRGLVGEVYNLGGEAETDNLTLARLICEILDEQVPDQRGPYSRLMRFVTDRKGHDWRYAVNLTKARSELDWRPTETLRSGLHKTVAWYLQHTDYLASEPDVASLRPTPSNKVAA